MIEIGMHKIYKNFGYTQVLKDINIEILKGDHVGIVGKNGSGKSTLFKLIMKKEFPDTGNISIRKLATIGYLEQIPTIDNENLTTKDILMLPFTSIQEIEYRMRMLEKELAQNATNEALLNKYAKTQELYIFYGGYEVEEKLNKVITSFELQNILDKPFTILSGGQKTVIKLAQLILTEPDILLLDEPTNHLDIKMLEWLEIYLKKYQGTVIIISHDRFFLDKVTNKTILLNDGESRLFHGNYSYTLKEQERLLLQQFEQYKTQVKRIEAIKASIKRYRDWGNQGDNEKFFKKAKELQKRLDKMDVIDKPQVEKKKLSLHFESERSGNEVIKVQDFGISFDNLSLFSDVNLTLYYQEKVVLIGDNGSGKTSFIKVILGQKITYQGQLQISKTVCLGYIPQEIKFKEDSDSILKVFRDFYPCLEGEARSLLAKFGFYQDQVYKHVGGLSGGEKVLLMLAILMQQKVNFLILDEPTNHIDIETREILEDALLEYKGTLLFISHDRYFIDKLATRQLLIKNGTIYSCYNS